MMMAHYDFWIFFGRRPKRRRTNDRFPINFAAAAVAAAASPNYLPQRTNNITKRRKRASLVSLRLSALPRADVRCKNAEKYDDDATTGGGGGGGKRIVTPAQSPRIVSPRRSLKKLSRISIP